MLKKVLEKFTNNNHVSQREIGMTKTGIALFLMLLFTSQSGAQVPQWGVTPEAFQQQYGNAGQLALSYQQQWHQYPAIQEYIFLWNPQSQRFELNMQNISPYDVNTTTLYQQQYQALVNALNQAYGQGTPYQQGQTQGMTWYPPNSRAVLSFQQMWYYRIQPYQQGR